MTCRELVGFLMEYLAGELSEGQRTEFDAHLAQCPWCVNYLRTYAETVRLGKAAFASLDAGVPEEVPERLAQAILAARSKGK